MELELAQMVPLCFFISLEWVQSGPGSFQGVHSKACLQRGESCPT